MELNRVMMGYLNINKIQKGSQNIRNVIRMTKACGIRYGFFVLGLPGE